MGNYLTRSDISKLNPIVSRIKLSTLVDQNFRLDRLQNGQINAIWITSESGTKLKEYIITSNKEYLAFDTLYRNMTKQQMLDDIFNPKPSYLTGLIYYPDYIKYSVAWYIRSLHIDSIFIEYFILQLIEELKSMHAISLVLMYDLEKYSIIINSNHRVFRTDILPDMIFAYFDLSNNIS